MSLRIAPPAAHPTSTTNTATSKLTTQSELSRGAPSVPGLPDTLRSSSTDASSSSAEPTTTTSTHPLEARLTQWRSTQEALKLETMRRTFGLAEPIRRGMELKMVREADWRPAALGRPSGVHEDILTGRDTEIGWEDVYTADQRVFSGEATDGGVHGDIERRVGMGKW